MLLPRLSLAQTWVSLRFHLWLLFPLLSPRSSLAFDRPSCQLNHSPHLARALSILSPVASGPRDLLDRTPRPHIAILAFVPSHLTCRSHWLYSCCCCSCCCCWEFLFNLSPSYLVFLGLPCPPGKCQHFLSRPSQARSLLCHKENHWNANQGSWLTDARIRWCWCLPITATTTTTTNTSTLVTCVPEITRFTLPLVSLHSLLLVAIAYFNSPCVLRCKGVPCLLPPLQLQSMAECTASLERSLTHRLICGWRSLSVASSYSPLLPATTSTSFFSYFYH